ncbi:MAG: ISNCY family transposase [Dehalococcoidia bacterium]
MLRDHAPVVDLFALVPALDLRFEPVLARLDVLLDDDQLFRAVRADLARRFPRTLCTGRPSTPVDVILRLLVVRRLYDWSYGQTQQFVGDSLVLRQFCRLGLARVPDHTTLIRWAALIQPATLQVLLDHVVELACQLQVTRGRKLRLDSTDVETAIHYPTDSRLLADGVRVLGRLVRRAKPVLEASLVGVRDAFRTRTRSARRCVQAMHRLARRRDRAAVGERQTVYRRLLDITRQVVRQAERVQTAMTGGEPHLPAGVARVGQQLAHVLPLVCRVIGQAERRVLQGEAVPAAEKVVSLIEPHTAVIPQHKPGQTVAFGHKVWLGEVEGGIITEVQVMDGAAADAPQVVPTLDRHVARFGRPPDLVTGDRGCSTATVRRQVAAAGVRQVALPTTGSSAVTAAARRAFRHAYRWRAGIEGRIGVLKHRYGLTRCRDHGEAGFHRWVGLGVLVANLVTIARTTAD